MARKKRVLRSKVKLILTLFAFSAAVTIAVVAIVRSTGGKVEKSSLQMIKPETEIVIIRDEMVVTSEEYGKIDYIANEGEKVTSGAIVAQVYKWGYNANTLQSLLGVQQDIRKLQISKLGDVVNRELVELDKAIEEKNIEITNCISKQIQQIKTANSVNLDLLVLERQLKELQIKRYEFLKTSSQTDIELQELYSKEQTDTADLSEWATPLQSESTGIISFFFDGYESIFNAKTIAQLNWSDVRALREGKTAKTTATANQRALYRIAQENVWYAVVSTSIDKKIRDQYIMGETYNFKLSGFYDKDYTGKLVYKNYLTKNAIYIFEINSSISEVLNMRFAQATIHRKFDGLVVPVNAIKTDEEKNYIYVKKGDEKVAVEVKVLFQNGKKAVFTTKDASITEDTHFVY